MTMLFLWSLLSSCTTTNEETKALPTQPNILFAVADDVSFPHMGAYGCSWVKTPAFDRIAKEGLLFNHAFTPNSKCAPSRSIILTGRNSWQLEEAANHVARFPDKFKSFFEVLHENGYRTGHVRKGWGPGKVGMINGQRRKLTGPAFNKATLDPTHCVYQSNRLCCKLRPIPRGATYESTFLFLVWLHRTTSSL